MKGPFAAMVLASCVMLGGCVFSSTKEVWPVGSGEEIPLAGSEYTCFGTKRNGEPTDLNHFRIVPQSKDDELWYLVTSLGENGISSPMSFHRVYPDRNLFVVAGRHEKTPGEDITFAWISAEYGAVFIAPSQEDIDRVAERFDVALEMSWGTWELSGSEQKQFLIALAKEYQDATVIDTCVVAH